ncbi:MAG: hypothetical protein PHY43_13015 [Verrucomicrobiales bacterium]|nr:hypothetical protein [Verrucomicrobiales bacterium]
MMPAVTGTAPRNETMTRSWLPILLEIEVRDGLLALLGGDEFRRMDYFGCSRISWFSFFAFIFRSYEYGPAA